MKKYVPQLHSTPEAPILYFDKTTIGQHKCDQYLHDFCDGLTQEQLEHVANYFTWEVGHRTMCDANCYKAAQEEYIAATNEALADGYLAEDYYAGDDRLKGARKNLQYYHDKAQKTAATSRICGLITEEEAEIINASRESEDDED
jgi:hypothetical protein